MTNNVELYILRLFFSYSLFQKYRDFLDLNYLKENSKDLYRLFRCVELFHESFPDKGVDGIDTLRVFHSSKFPAKESEELGVLFSALKDIVPDETIAADYLREHKNRARAAKLAILGFEVAEGRRDFSELVDLAGLVSKEEVVLDESEFVSDDIELLAKKMNEPGLSWRLGSMNQMLGPLRKGDFGFIFKRPETGGTSFLADQVTFMAEQCDRPILWFNNEQEGSVVLSRCIQACSAVETRALLQNLSNLRQTYREKTGGRIKLYDSASIHKRDVDRLCRKYDPCLILFDQIDKIHGFDSDRHDLELKALYQWARELAKEYGPVIGVCQAGATAEGKRYLTMDDVDSSKTAKQGEADWILGVGKSNQDGMESIRHLHLCKNKLLGSASTIPELRHGKRDVRFFPEVCRYEDIK